MLGWWRERALKMPREPTGSRSLGSQQKTCFPRRWYYLERQRRVSWSLPLVELLRRGGMVVEAFLNLIQFEEERGPGYTKEELYLKAAVLCCSKRGGSPYLSKFRSHMVHDCYTCRNPLLITGLRKTNSF